MSRRIWIAVALVVVVIAAAVPSWIAVQKHRDGQARRAAVAAFAQAWQSGTLAKLGYANDKGADVATAVRTITAQLQTAAAKDAPSQVRVGSVAAPKGGTVKATLQVSWTLRGGQLWSYPTTVQFVKVAGRWLPKYQPGVIQPDLAPGWVLRSLSIRAQRGQIIGANNEVLVTDRPVVLVGLEPSRTTDIDSSAAQIAAITGVDGAALAKRAKAAGKDAFVLAISLRSAAYQQMRDRLQPIPGAVFQQTTLPLGPTADFARALLGSVGQATADSVKQSGGRVQTGQLTGLSGVQLAYDKQLAGTPGVEVQAVPPSPTSKTGSQSAASNPKTLFSTDPIAGKALHITLDSTIQTAADNALSAATKPAGLVAIQISTGKVLAVANGGPNASGYNRALLGQYPPGSTFKVASGLGLLEAGITPDTTVQCPATVTVSGRTFKNAEHEKLGAVPFRTDFANSCNTAFIGSAGRISAAELTTAAGSLGYGQPNRLGVTAFTGQVPSSGDAVEHAADMIGQGRVLTSPVTVAGATAAVAAGRWTAPQLVLDGSTVTRGNALPAGADSDLKQLMRAVVTSGTATALRNVPGGPVSGKTGTAEFGHDKPPQTHAWFTGFQGDLAFAVVVEGGGFGAKAAVPLVRGFLTRLAAQHAG